MLIESVLHDPYAYIAGALVVFAATTAAAYIPSRNAARVDPATALRHD
jgi:ABC-type antimicrobial peptide transport system permease subunit